MHGTFSFVFKNIYYIVDLGQDGDDSGRVFAHVQSYVQKVMAGLVEIKCTVHVYH